MVKGLENVLYEEMLKMLGLLTWRRQRGYLIDIYECLMMKGVKKTDSLQWYPVTRGDGHKLKYRKLY